MVKRVAATKWIVFASAFGLIATSAFAKDDKPWSLNLKAGATYDDNIVIEQIDTATGVADTSADFELAAGYKLVDTKVSKLAVGYDFSQSLHSKLPAFDIQSHALSISGSMQTGGTTLSASYSFYHLFLGGRNFLDLHVVDPSVLIPVSSHVFVRGAYLYLNKSFLGTNGRRSASHHQPGLQAFYFFDQARAYVLAGADYEIEDASGPEFSYKGYALTARLQLPFEVLSRDATLKADYTYLHLNYDNITPSIGVKRFETRSTVRIGAVIPIAGGLSFLADYKYIDRNSNLLSTKYTENILSGALSYDF